MGQNSDVRSSRSGCYTSFVVLLGMILIVNLTGCERTKTSTDTPTRPASPSETKESNTVPVERTGPYLVGVLYWSMNIPGQVAMRAGLEAAADQINLDAKLKDIPGVTLIPNVAGDGEEGMERQIQQMGALVEQKVDLIIVQPTDIAALSDSLKAANKAQIPVVAYDQHILGGKLSSFLTSDNYRAGFLGGEYAAANFSDDQTLRIIMVEYPHVSSTVARVNGFIDALEYYKQPYQILKTYSAVEPISGAKAGADILSDFPEKGSFDVVFTVNDGGGLAVVSALENAGRDEVFVATVDGDPASVENIRRGGITRIDSAQFCGELGAESMRTAYRLLRGENVGREILIPVFPITRETVDMYKGWTAPVPEPFIKPWHSTSPRWTGDVSIIGS